MKIDFSQKLKTLTGETFKMDDKEILLSEMCVDALLATEQNEPIGGQEKMKRWEIAKKIHNKEEVEITSEEITLIKERVGKILITPIVGSINDLLEA